MRTTRKFDHAKGFKKFSTACRMWWIRQYVTRAITDQRSAYLCILAETLQRVKRQHTSCNKRWSADRRRARSLKCCM